jgi:hypothetical protein
MRRRFLLALVLLVPLFAGAFKASLQGALQYFAQGLTSVFNASLQCFEASLLCASIS